MIRKLLITLGNRDFEQHICILYRRPTGNQSKFLLNLDLLNETHHIKGQNLFCGDPKIDL